MPAPPEVVEEPVAPPKPKTELEAIQMQANQVTDESLESTRRMLALCEEVCVFHFELVMPIIIVYDNRAKKPASEHWWPSMSKEVSHHEFKRKQFNLNVIQNNWIESMRTWIALIRTCAKRRRI